MAAEDRITVVGGVCTIKLVGEIDFSNASMISDWIFTAIDTCGVAIVELDFSAVVFLDSTGIASLLNVWRHAANQEITLTAVKVKPQIRRLLRVAGVDRALGMQ